MTTIGEINEEKEGKATNRKLTGKQQNPYILHNIFRENKMYPGEAMSAGHPTRIQQAW